MFSLWFSMPFIFWDLYQAPLKDSDSYDLLMLISPFSHSALMQDLLSVIYLLEPNKLQLKIQVSDIWYKTVKMTSFQLCFHHGAFK